MRSLRDFQKQRAKERAGNSNYTSASFVVGCAARINEKLKELAPINWAATQDLIVKELNMNLTKSRSRGKEVHEGSVMAGHRAGEHARFDKPGSEAGIKRLK